MRKIINNVKTDYGPVVEINDPHDPVSFPANDETAGNNDANDREKVDDEKRPVDSIIITKKLILVFS